MTIKQLNKANELVELKNKLEDYLKPGRHKVYLSRDDENGYVCGLYLDYEIIGAHLLGYRDKLETELKELGIEL